MSFSLMNVSNLAFIFPPYGKYGVGVIFFPKIFAYEKNVAISSIVLLKNWDWKLLVYRKVPVNTVEGIWTNSIKC
jgi:hypothetical protein